MIATESIPSFFSSRSATGRPSACEPSLRGRRRGFSITELLVVIGIIVLLVALLLVALGNVQTRAKAVKTRARLQSFADACNSFQIEHGYYPGVVPEEILANDPKISSTENALLHLMGGFVREEDVGEDPFDDASIYPGPSSACGNDGWSTIQFATPSGGTYDIKVNPSKLGEGPVIDGKPYAPYYTPGPSEIGVVQGQKDDADACPRLPDLIDAWGQPVIYLRQVRTVGPLTYNVNEPNRRPQFFIGAITPYLYSGSLGEFGQDQTDDGSGSVLRQSNGDGDQNKNLAQILRHPAFGPANDPHDRQVASRGGFYLISAGADGIFFGRTDVPDPDTPGSFFDNLYSADDPRLVGEFDDVIVTGGG